MSINSQTPYYTIDGCRSDRTGICCSPLFFFAGKKLQIEFVYIVLCDKMALDPKGDGSGEHAGMMETYL